MMRLGLAHIYEECTVLELGARGVFQGEPFTLVGRTCIRGRKGALSNEWVMRFDKNGDTDSYFLSEGAGGALAVFEEAPILPTRAAATAAAAIGRPLEMDFLVIEHGKGARVAQWGSADVDGQSGVRRSIASTPFAYVDLTSRSKPGALASIDFGSNSGGDGEEPPPPRVFRGQRMSLATLSLTPRAATPRFYPAPDVSRPKGVEPCLEVGDAGMLEGVEWRVLGMVSKRTSSSSSSSSSPSSSRWDEYLIHARSTGELRWLVVSDDGHWSIVSPIDAGCPIAGEGAIRHENVEYVPLGEKTVASVEWAMGELPWEITLGEASNVEDFVHAPWILTREHNADELSWSRATWLSPDAVAKAFGAGKRVLSLPKPVGRAPNAPGLKSTSE